MKADTVNTTCGSNSILNPYSVPQIPTKAGAIYKLLTFVRSRSLSEIYLYLSCFAFWFRYLLNPNILLYVIPGCSHIFDQNGSTVILAGIETWEVGGKYKMTLSFQQLHCDSSVYRNVWVERSCEAPFNVMPFIRRVGKGAQLRITLRWRTWNNSKRILEAPPSARQTSPS